MENIEKEVMKHYGQLLFDKPEDLSNILSFNRKVYDLFSESSIPKSDETICYTSRLLLDDFLKNVFEGAPVDDKHLLVTVRAFGEYFLNCYDNESKEHLNKYLSHFNKLIFSKKPLSRSERLKGYQFQIDCADAKIIVGNLDGDYPIFPDLDSILSDPDSAKKIIRIFKQKLNKIVDEKNIDKLCFIDKRKGPLGALLLLSSLTSQLGINSCILRSQYLDKVAKIKGSTPMPDDRIAIIYDIANSGSGISEVAKYLYEEHSAIVKYALVFFDYKHEAKSKLRREGIQLEALLDLPTVKQELFNL